MLYVLDSNVAVKWFLPEPLADKASSLLERFRAGAVDLLAPEILLAEFAHALIKHHRRGQLTEVEVHDIWTDFRGLRIRTVAIPVVANEALQLALVHMPRYYDALYVALAQEQRCSVVTADEAMVSAFKPLGCVIALQALAL